MANRESDPPLQSKDVHFHQTVSVDTEPSPSFNHCRFSFTQHSTPLPYTHTHTPATLCLPPGTPLSQPIIKPQPLPLCHWDSFSPHRGTELRVFLCSSLLDGPLVSFHPPFAQSLFPSLTVPHPLTSHSPPLSSSFSSSFSASSSAHSPQACSRGLVCVIIMPEVVAVGEQECRKISPGACYILSCLLSFYARDFLPCCMQNVAFFFPLGVRSFPQMCVFFSFNLQSVWVAVFHYSLLLSFVIRW